jgi:soluble lytic murein transglycosylase-like protein
LAVALVLGPGAGGAVAQQAPGTAAAAPKDFTFKRVAVGKPAPGTKRITVQIDPAEQARILAANPAVPLPPTPEEAAAARARSAAVAPEDGGSGAERPVPSASYAWYWELMSPLIEDRSSGRLEAAVAALSRGPEGAAVRAPRLASMQKVADAYGAEILKATVGTGVSPALVLAVIGIESAGRSAAVSHAGATGLMQLMPATAERFGVTDRTDPAQNIRGGVAYLDWLLKEFGNDPILALAGYNAGEGAVKNHGGVPPYAETRDYVPKVLAAWSVARGLCLTQPQLISDGCVFRRSTADASPAPAPKTEG